MASVAQTDDVRGEVGRLLARSVGATGMAAIDRTYLVELVAARSGIPAADADKRVGDAVEQMKTSIDRARKIGIVLGFITAATLLLGAAASWSGAVVGGRHRDESTLWPGFARHAKSRNMWSKQTGAYNA